MKNYELISKLSEFPDNSDVSFGEITVQSKEYSQLTKQDMPNVEEYFWIINTLKSNIQTLALIADETVKCENNEESNVQKFSSIKAFAQYVKSFTDISLDFLKRKDF